MPKSTAEDGASLTSGDFDEIEKAVMETARGRWFLAEYAKRLRQTETQSMLAAVAKLETALAASQDEIVQRLTRALQEQPGASDAPRAAAPAADIDPRQMRYFKADEDIFDPIANPRSGPEAVPANVHPFDASDPHAVLASLPTTAPLRDLLAQPAASEPPKRRIVIIRHKPGDEIDVPLQQDLAETG